MSKNKSLLTEVNLEIKELFSINDNFVDARIDYTTESLIVYTKSNIDLPSDYKGIPLIQERKDVVLDYSDFLNTFLAFTEYVVPFGQENIFESMLPSGWKKDSIGNFFYTIGDSKTLFTTHLDNYTKTLTKVNHIVEENDGNTIIKTDGKSILGGDNKVGVCILCNMITKGIPGTYFFFIGEEPIGGSPGIFGSSNALKNNPEFFSKFDRAIAFDRKEMWSIVSRQMGRNCCSDEFVNALATQLSINGLPKYKNDPTGYYTDTAVFMDVIPECTNISVGVWGEHTKKEAVLLEYFVAVAHAAENIDWDSLPVTRERKGFGKPKFENKKVENVFNNVKSKLSSLGLLCTNSDHFAIGTPMEFNYWFKDSDYKLIFNENGTVTYNGQTESASKILQIISKDHLPEVDFVQLGITIDKPNMRIIINGDPQKIGEYLLDIAESDRAYLLPNSPKNRVWTDNHGNELDNDTVITILEYEYGL